MPGGEGLVLDTSVCVPWFVAEEQTPWAKSILHRLGSEPAWVPALWIIEFANVLKVAERRKRLDSSQRNAALLAAEGLALQTDNTLHRLGSLAALADAHQLTAYDAVYLELAQRRRLTLVSLDSALLAAAQKAGLKVLTAPTP